MKWCDKLGAEPFICLNMGTGTLESALHWLEYMNSTQPTYWAEMRKKNGHPEPYNVKYIALGNEVWGPWQVGQATAEDCEFSTELFGARRRKLMLSPSQTPRLLVSGGRR